MAKNTNNRSSTGDNKTKESKLLQRKKRQENRNSGVVADWETIDPELIIKLIAASTALGYNVAFGYYKNKETYTISFYDWDTKERLNEYCSPNEDAVQWIVDLVIWLEG